MKSVGLHESGSVIGWLRYGPQKISGAAVAWSARSSWHFFDPCSEFASNHESERERKWSGSWLAKLRHRDGLYGTIPGHFAGWHLAAYAFATSLSGSVEPVDRFLANERDPLLSCGGGAFGATRQGA